MRQQQNPIREQYRGRPVYTDPRFDPAPLSCYPQSDETASPEEFVRRTFDDIYRNRPRGADLDRWAERRIADLLRADAGRVARLERW